MSKKKVALIGSTLALATSASLIWRLRRNAHKET